MNSGRRKRSGCFPTKSFSKTITALLACLLIGLTGCSRIVPEPQLVVEPRLTGTAEIEGVIRMADLPADLCSPDGKFFLAVEENAGGCHLKVVPLDGDYKDAIPVDSVSKSWTSGFWFDYRPLGWTSEAEFVYAGVGWQPSGEHKGERGVSLVIGRVPQGAGDESGEGAGQAKATTEEIGFFLLEYGSGSLETLFLAGQKKVYLNNNTTIWVLDIAGKNLTVLKEDLPDYAYRHPIPSPTGDYFVYELNEDEKSGIFILDTKTKEERPLAVNGDTMSFYPAWSPDGKYVAAYIVDKKEGATGTSWRDYLLFEGEDTAQSVGSGITVFDAAGNIAATIKVEGKYLHGFCWAADSRTLGFVAGSARIPETGDESAPMGSVLYESIWLARIDQASKGAVTPVRLADIPKDDQGEPRYAALAAFDPDAAGVYYNVYRQGIWYCSQKADPVKLSDGRWTRWEGSPPRMFGDSLVALVDREPGKEFLLFDKGEATQFGESDGSWVWLAACSESKIVLFVGNVPAEDDSAPFPPAYPKSGKLMVYDMLKPQ